MGFLSSSTTRFVLVSVLLVGSFATSSAESSQEQGCLAQAPFAKVRNDKEDPRILPKWPKDAMVYPMDVQTKIASPTDPMHDRWLSCFEEEPDATTTNPAKMTTRAIAKQLLLKKNKKQDDKVGSLSNLLIQPIPGSNKTFISCKGGSKDCYGDEMGNSSRATFMYVMTSIMAALAILSLIEVIVLFVRLKLKKKLRNNATTTALMFNGLSSIM
eukprot:g4683.t1